MKTLAIVCAFSGLVSLAFAYWGLQTVAGRRTFDEMAGMIPLAAVPAGAVLLLLAALFGWRAAKG